MSLAHLRTLRSANAIKRVPYSWGSSRCMSVGRQVEETKDPLTGEVTLLPDIDVSELMILWV